ncbi:hypothetical protein [Burkholderia cenocepacia]|uniref:hypothetical protein n=1 Tax=Burkholderia cenocepacia TaxID=95486 RepID=UPI0006784A89|nr:hypothetical protein [Burkholderia cenocepacia]KWU25857.1 hypothetical protein AS149_27630 [Burkholderia cenocepacia]
MTTGVGKQLKDFDPAVAASDSDILYSAQAGLEKKMTYAQLATYMQGKVIQNKNVETFIPGDGVTPGTFLPGGASITLANSYGSINNIDVFAEGAPQLDCTLTENVLGFPNGGVPNVSKITVKGALTVPVGAIGAGAVGDAQLANGSRIFYINKNTQLTPDYYECVADWNGVSGSDNTLNFQRLVNDVAAIGGGEIDLGNNGFFAFKNLVVPDGVRIHGRGRYRSGLVTTNVSGSGTANGGVIQLGNSSMLRGLSLTAATPMTGGILVLLLGNLAEVSDYQMTNYYTGVQAGSAALEVINARVAEGNMFSPSLVSGGNAIIGANFGNLVVEGVIGSGPASGPQPYSGLRLLNGDTAFIKAVNMTRHGAGLLMNPSPVQNLYSCVFSDSDFDSAVGQSSAQIAPLGGAVWGAKFNNVWFGLSNQDGLLISGAGGGTVDGVGLSNCEFPGNGGCGLNVSGANVSNVIVNGGWAAGNSQDGYRFANGTSKFQLNGVTGGPCSGRGPNGGYGCQVVTGASNAYVIANSLFAGNSTGALLDNGTGSSKFVNNNLLS